MEFNGVKEISIYGTDCVVDISRGDGNCEFISAKEKYFEVSLDDGTLTVRQKSRNLLYRIIYHRIEFKLVLPRGFKGKLRFRNKNGGLYVKDGEFTDIELAADNGKFDISDCACGNFRLKMSNGTFNAKNVKVADSATVKCANGNIKVESVTAPNLSISCTNASLSAIDVTAKKIDCSTSNGTIDASGISADDLRLETSNGKISAAPLGTRDEYALSADTSNGSITVDGVAYKKLSDINRALKKLNVKTANGDIDIRFV